MKYPIAKRWYHGIVARGMSDKALTRLRARPGSALFGVGRFGFFWLPSAYSGTFFPRSESPCLGWRSLIQAAFIPRGRLRQRHPSGCWFLAVTLFIQFLAYLISESHVLRSSGIRPYRTTQNIESFLLKLILESYRFSFIPNSTARGFPMRGLARFHEFQFYFAPANCQADNLNIKVKLPIVFNYRLIRSTGLDEF